MAGVDLPVTPMEHHYLITDAIPEVAALKKELPLTVDLEGFTYLRHEGLKATTAQFYKRLRVDVSERTTARGPSAAPLPLVRRHDRRGRALGRQLGTGSSSVLRATGFRRSADAAALECARHRRGGMPRHARKHRTPRH